MRLLLQHTPLVNVNAVDCKGRSPLHLASAHDHERIVALLLSRGADARLLDASGIPALAWASGFAKGLKSPVDVPSPDQLVRAAILAEEEACARRSSAGMMGVVSPVPAPVPAPAPTPVPAPAETAAVTSFTPPRVTSGAGTALAGARLSEIEEDEKR